MDVSLSELQELLMDREAWHAVIHGVTKSRTRLSDWTELNWSDLAHTNAGEIQSPKDKGLTPVQDAMASHILVPQLQP